MLMLALARSNKIRPLCYEHDSEMILRELSSSEDGNTYCCQEPDCLVTYTRSDGYFLNTQDRLLIKEGPIPPHQYCLKDQYPMYLLEVQPDQPSFRLWRCPKCSMSLGGGTLM
jgi:hypothetical protein